MYIINKPNLTLTNSLTLGETVFIVTLSVAFGVLWWAYSFIYDIISLIMKPFAINGLIEGIWFMAGPFFAYVIRKPCSAILGEMIASTVEGVISQWGISAVVSGLCQGLPVELLFFLYRYKIWNKTSMATAGITSALGGYVTTYYWYHYSSLSIGYNLATIGCNIISGAILGGLLAKYLADKLALTGVLNQFKISYA